MSIRFSAHKILIAAFAIIVCIPASMADGTSLVYSHGGSPVAVSRPDHIDSPVDLMVTWLAGPDRQERQCQIEPLLPVTQADKIVVDDDKLTMFLTLPQSYLESLTWEQNDAVLHAITTTLGPEYGIYRISVLVRTDEGYGDLDVFIEPGPPIPPKPFEDTSTDPVQAQDWPGQPSHGGQLQYPGSLTGKSIFLSQSHGWYCHETTHNWLTQRGNTNDIVEDFINAEAINQYLVQYLFNAGAGVYTCRERDMNSDEAIIDNDQVGYTDSGTWSTATASSGVYNTNYKSHAVTTGNHAWATWEFLPVTADFYEVYVWYRGTSSTTTEAHYTIEHNGGSTPVTVNQQRDGWTWKSLGRFYFSPDDPVTRRQVTLSSQGSDISKIVVADAVRFGGGMGSIPDPTVSQRPRWEESGKYYARFMGCDSCDNSTVTAMPNYAKWESESWEDSIYFSWHTNAPNPGTGTSSFIHETYAVTDSDILQDWVHAEIINDIRSGYDADWYDRGQRTANFGEINSNHNDEMPALLIELAFHDTPDDALCLKDPKFRMLASRAIYQGMEKFFADQSGRTPHLLPEPPVDLRVTNGSAGMVDVTWQPPPFNNGNDLLGDAATGYRVYVSETGLGFADAIATTQTSMVLGPFSPGAVRYVKVSAVNAGGESFTSPVLAVKVPEPSQSVNLLLVDAFDRIDRYALIPQYESSALGTDLRMFLDRMNTFDYVVTHSEACRGFPGGFDSCVNEVVAQGIVDLGAYLAVDWIAGEESRSDETVSDVEQLELMGFMDSGGGLLISGAELGWDLDAYGSSADRQFFADYLLAEYTIDDAGSDALEGQSGTIFDGVDNLLYDYDSYEIYAVEYPDGLSPSGVGQTGMIYSGTGYGAAIVGDDSHRVVTMGVPFETLFGTEDRVEIMERILDYLMPQSPCVNSGDVNFSGHHSATDAQLAFQVVLGLFVPTWAEECAADCDGSGTITAGDAQQIFNIVLGLQTECFDPLVSR